MPIKELRLCSVVFVWGLLKTGKLVVTTYAFKINVCRTFYLGVLFCAFARVSLNEVCKFAL